MAFYIDDKLFTGSHKSTFPETYDEDSDNCLIMLETWYKDGILHNLSGPAKIETYTNGYSLTEWYFKGKLHNSSGPAKIYQAPYTCVKSWFLYGKLHNSSGPAVITYDHKGEEVVNVTWYQHGKRHRTDGPASYGRRSVDFEEWYFDDKLHNPFGPAKTIRELNGGLSLQEWYTAGVLHREDGPALIRYHKNGSKKEERWYLDGTLHNPSGPEVIEYDENGNVINEEDYKVEPLKGYKLMYTMTGHKDTDWIKDGDKLYKTKNGIIKYWEVQS